MIDIKKPLIDMLKKLNVFDRVNFIILYGSQANGKKNPMSDIDICISIDIPEKERTKLRIKLLGEFSDRYDIQIFEELPLRVKMGVLKGKLLYCKNREKLTLQAIGLMREYEDFLPRFNYYITGVKHAERASI